MRDEPPRATPPAQVFLPAALRWGTVAVGGVTELRARAVRGALTPQMGRSCVTGGVKSRRKRQNFLGVLGGTRLESPHVVNCAEEYPTSRRVS